MSAFEKKAPQEPDGSWMETYGDMVTLLLCFFILLASVSKVDSVLYEQVQSGMTSEIGKQPPQRPIESMRKELTEVVNAAAGGSDAADVATDDRGVVLNLDAGALFQPGSAEIKSELQPLLKEVVETLVQPRFETYRFEIQGHTDDTPVQTAQFPSNFDLAAARALSTMRAMVALGLPAERILVTSFGPFAPRVPNRLEDGTPLPANQGLNRRVAVHVYPR
ncbi:flagellar motor protein MotB [Magnetospirillum sp. UT-4]|uniref:OmpA/MotB family protein n=1 Tax=Magnetospirillum sp. UT-4 TaxID=2681467 RepID=UPI001380B642|nr:flagellar motor protein MotB [Magnetospirillum sp. UT-4]CAA7615245.1 OmpA/MotB [Magnetospirillum sp. UT-4]